MRDVLIFATGFLASCDGSGAPARPSEPPIEAPAESPKNIPHETAMTDRDAVEPSSKRVPQKHRLGLTDAQLVEGSADFHDARKAMVRAGFEGIAIDAAFSIDPQEHDALHVMGFFARRPEPAEDFDDNAIVVAIDLERDIARADAALRSSKRGAEDEEPGEGSSAFIATPFAFDVVERIHDFPWSVGRHRLYLVHAGVLSNGVTVQLGSGERAGTEPADLVGVSIEAPRSVTSGEAATCLLKGRVPAGTQRVHVVGTGDAGPFMTTVEVDQGGAYSVDAMQHKDLPSGAGTWHFYAFAGEYAAGPATVTIAD